MADSGDSSFKYDYLNTLPSKIPINPYHHSHDTSAAASSISARKAVPLYPERDLNPQNPNFESGTYSYSVTGAKTRPVVAGMIKSHLH